MSLKFNTFRPDRYLRSEFREGRYLLAAELTDVELEILDQLRKAVAKTVGNIAIEDAWKVSRLSTNQLSIAPGDAWYSGLPISLRSSSDQLVSGASLTLGIVPPGVTVTDASNSSGKILTFTPTTTPTGLYRITVSVEEQIITNVEDPFLKNVNITEVTGQKVRLLFKLNVVTNSTQTETPIPYTPSTGTYSTANLVNNTVITPTAAGNGELLLTTPISGSQQIDGRDLELTIRNNSGIGGGTPIPTGSSDQQAFYNGTLIDSIGGEYHINAIFNDVVSTQVIIRLDKEPNQPNPQIINTLPYTIIKRDVYVADDTTGSPLGKLFWSIATINWNTTNGFVHASVVTDLRTRVISEESFENIINQKFNLQLTDGGIVDVDIDGETLNWSSAFTLVNPSGSAQTIAANSAVLLDGGTLAYTMNLAGGAIAVGNLAVTISSNVGSLTSFSGGPDLSLVKIGNILKVGAESTAITAIDNVNKTVTVSPSLTTIGPATIYRDSFSASTVKLNEKLFILAARNGSKITVGGILELSAGESNAIYDVRIQYPTGLTASTNITLPNNSQTGKPQFYSATKRNLEIAINQLPKFQGADWLPIDSQTIQVPYALPNDAEIHFRIDSLPAGSVGGGSGGGSSGTLQDAYDNGNTIITTGLPLVVGGTASKVAQFLGDIEVTGVIDPTGMELTPQATNPLAPGAKGVWANNSNQLVYENGTTAENVSQRFDDLESGVSSPIQGSASVLKTGNVLTTLSAPSTKPEALTGEGFSANTSYLVRWGIDGEVVDRVYRASAANASDKKYTAIGLLLSTFALSIGDTGRITTTGTHTLGSSDTPFLTSDIGKYVYLKADGSGGFTTVTPFGVGDAQFRVGTVQDVDKIWVDYRQLDAIVPVPLYDERILFASGLTAGTDITLPVNSRNGGAAQLYTFAEGRLTIHVNQTLKFQGSSWIEGTSPSTQIQLVFDLPNDAEVHFRMEPIGSGVLTSNVSISGGLQDAYNAENTITTSSGSPFTVNGPVSEKIAVFNGDITVTGVIDPTAIQLTPQGSNPLTSGQAGIWVDSGGALQHDDGTNLTTNITQVITQVIEGTAQTTLSKSYSNITGSTIPAFTPVYLPITGQIDLADGTNLSKFKVAGVTLADILNAASGNVASAGIIPGVLGLTHGEYIYLGLAPGSLTDVGPTILGGYPSGFEVIKIGIMDGTDLILQIQYMGRL